ncbi:hypothetical protein SBA1_820047 [Candidatus Sulfotelmatobacter kueseliae]|uniref:Uncharacterized protein n=1 Tax=Candidatus Sulfotelmatobacter kueseliae TaxID=2042962 RepID=A0A2U3L8I8_9BACT|nr:hypothetical protein SBA1_820047 [Candidatus Sulfotelmatobacter kueseliae]
MEVRPTSGSGSASVTAFETKRTPQQLYPVYDIVRETEAGYAMACKVRSPAIGRAA